MLLAAAVVGGWLSGQEAVGWPFLEGLATRRQTASPPPRELACLPAGIRFPDSYLDGPDLTRDEFLATPLGHLVEEYFAGAPDEPEAAPFPAVDGFSVVPGSLVLGFRGGLPVLAFEPSRGAVVLYPGCSLTRVQGDGVAVRWFLEQPVDADTTTLHIGVSAGGCVPGTEILTDCCGQAVIEGPDSVSVAMWATARPRSSATATTCDGTGFAVHDEVLLEEPLGDRVLLDGGFVPPFIVER